MKQHTDESVIRNMEQRKERERDEGGKGWANNMTREDIIEFGPGILDGDTEKLNEILIEKGFDPITYKK